MSLRARLLAATLLLPACDPADSAEDGGDTGGTVDDDDGPPVMTTSEPGDDPLGVVEAHNAVRASAQPTPSPPLPDLVWDDDLASVAQDWADACVFMHSNNPYGENLYAGSGTPTGEAAVEAWASEAADYDYASNGCSSVCGHYTQIVWRSSQRVGCAFADCPTLQGAGFGGRFWVCNYDPPGNFIGEPPY